MVNMQLKDNKELRILIAKKGSSLRSFSNSIGVSHSYLSQILSGKRQPSPTTAYKIAKGLNVGIEDIFLIKMVAK